jgi:hypothetical protein
VAREAEPTGQEPEPSPRDHLVERRDVWAAREQIDRAAVQRLLPYFDLDVVAWVLDVDLIGEDPAPPPWTANRRRAAAGGRPPEPESED